MSGVPTLHRDDIRAALDELYRAGREHHLFAFYGSGELAELPTERAGKVLICPVNSELELRMNMPRLDDEQARIAFLVPWRSDVPMDLAGRFALNGRVRVIGKEERILRLFRAEELDVEVLRSPLVDYLLTPAAPANLRSRRSRLTLDEMWLNWLSHEWGLAAEEELALDRLIAWTASDARGPAFESKLRAAHGDGLIVALEEYLAQKRGDLAVVTFRAWCKGRAERVLQYALVLQPVLDAPGSGPWIRAKLKADFNVQDQALAMRVARQLVEAAPTALREFSRRAPRVELRALLDQADALADDPEIRAHLVQSQFLPCAWRMRLDDFGSALAAAAAAPDARSFAQAAQMLERVEKHELFKDESTRAVMQRAEMALRLLAWLASDRSVLEPFATDPPHADVERLGRWYAAEGGFVDWARRTARGTNRTAFDQGVQAVVAAADAQRRELDARFARALPKWIQARRPATQVVSIEDVSKRVIARFLDDKSDRSLLVLLLDGMAWVQAVEILLSLQEQPDPWGPIAWHADRKHKLGDAHFPVVIAGLPTVTEVSRAAFFAGKSMTSGKDHGSEKDPERWRDNSVISKYSQSGDWPQLLLRGDGHEAHGVASEQALSLIKDRTRRVVALVINAIDSALKGDSQQWHPWRAENVRSLPQLLQQARESGRTVLLASDHGHVPADLLAKSLGAVTGGARWRPLLGGETLSSSEVKLSGEGVWLPKGAQAVALISDDAHRYGGGAHAGEHGGATLAEVVAPCVLIRWEDPLMAQHDAALSPTALSTPVWWYRELVRSVEVQKAAPKPRAPRAEVVATNQLGLPEITPAHAPAAAPARSPASTPPPAELPMVRALAATESIKELKRDRRDRLLRALSFLLERHGVAKLEAFAAHMSLPPFRARGLVANELQPVLNVDGYQVLYCDEHHVRLELQMLAQQFEVPL